MSEAAAGNPKLLQTGLRDEAGLSWTFVALTAGACAIATFGLLGDSVAVIIGAMLIAPLMTPIVALAFAVVSGEVAVLRRAVITLSAGASLAIAFSTLLAALVDLPGSNAQIASRAHPNLLDLGVALAAGAVAGYARLRPGIASTVGGAAIAVALMPPLCVVGIGLAQHNPELAYGASLLFATNLIGITLACAAVFTIGGLASHYAGRGLAVTAFLVVVTAVPLAFATTKLIRQARLEATLRTGLLQKTQTFRRADLVSASVDWLTHPIGVTLLVRTRDPITQTQVGFLQAFAEQRIGQPLRLVVEVAQVRDVTAPPQPRATGAVTSPLDSVHGTF
jgi:uncharacterized hydrophobic protein (TIGR00271 family)